MTMWPWERENYHLDLQLVSVWCVCQLIVRPSDPQLYFFGLKPFSEPCTGFLVNVCTPLLNIHIWPLKVFPLTLFGAVSDRAAPICISITSFTAPDEPRRLEWTFSRTGPKFIRLVSNRAVVSSNVRNQPGSPLHSLKHSCVKKPLKSASFLIVSR